jgi:hypothetical protein
MVQKPIAWPIATSLIISGHGASQGAARPPRPTSSGNPTYSVSRFF